MRRCDETLAEDRLLRDGARRFLQERYPWKEPAARRGTGNPAAAWREMADLGWFAMALPEELGGFGADAHRCLLILQEAGRVLLDTPVMTTLLIAPRLAAGAYGPALRPLLEGVAAGDVRFALVTGSDRRAPLRFAAGMLDGTSALAVGAADATHWLVAADGAVLCLDAAAIPAAREDARLIDGRMASVLRFDAVAVPDAALVATGGAAAVLAEEAADLAVAGTVADALGALSAGVGLTTDYLRNRRQFGQPLGSFQAVQHLMADSYCEMEGLASLLLWLGAAIDGDPSERRRAARAAKIFLGRQGLAAASRCIQVTGGMGMAEEYPIGHVFKRLQTAAALFGTADHHLHHLAAG
ncbi:MAG TPA: acyl-CoA dehydrogenase [Azospirillum sp.]|nr:acyl-CoA dehydrogenase [Azospirillum sp.]